MFSFSCASPVRFKLCLVGPMMTRIIFQNGTLLSTRQYSRICPPPPARAVPFTHVADNISKFGSQKKIQKPRQLLSLPAFPAHLRHPLPGKKTINHCEQPSQGNAATWLKYYFDDVSGSVIQTHFDKGPVLKECSDLSTGSKGKQEQTQCLQKINPNEAMEVGVKLYVPVSVAEAKISKRIDTIPSETLYPNADEIEYLQRLVMYNVFMSQDSATMILNKPPKLPVKGIYRYIIVWMPWLLLH